MADLIVLEDDPYVCEEEALAEIMPIGTMVGGTWRYRTF
jgi:predicted amidohydrolase YtcJ